MVIYSHSFIMKVGMTDINTIIIIQMQVSSYDWIIPLLSEMYICSGYFPFDLKID